MSVTITQAIEVAEQLVELNQTILLLGPPGIGKTDTMKEIARRTGRKLFLEHPAVSAPEDYKGFAMFHKDEADFFPLGQWKEIMAYPNPLIIGVDDLPQAPIAVQNGFMQYLHPRGRTLGKHRIPDHAAVIACGNRKEDNAGVMGLTEPLKDRFTTILNIEVSLDEWCQWAMTHEIDPFIIAFMQYRPKLLSQFKPSRDMTRSPTPRAWEGVSNLLKLNWSNDALLTEALTGSVGEQASVEFMQFRRLLKKLPDLDDIEAGIVSDGSHLDMNACYAIVGALSIRGLTNQTLHNVSKFVETLPTEFKVLWSEIWYKRNKNTKDEAGIPLASGPSWGGWIQKYADQLNLD